MKIARLSAVAALATGLGAPAMALDFGSGFSLVGDVELEYLSGSGDDSTYGFADLTLGWRSQGGGAVGFGFDVALVDIEFLDDSDRINAFWGGLVLTTSFGEFTIGNPRPLLTTMIDTPAVGGVRIFDLEIGSVTGSSLENFAFSDGVNLAGLSFKGGSGDLTYGVSYHTFDFGGPDVDAIELALNYQLGNTLIQGGIEVLSVGSQSFEKVLIGATYADDRWSAGLLLTNSSQGGGDLSAIKVFGDYAITEAFTLGVQALNFTAGSSDNTYYGVTGEFGFGTGGFAELGAFSFSGGGDTVYNASVGYRF